jgi:protein SCO1/2
LSGLLLAAEKWYRGALFLGFFSPPFNASCRMLKFIKHRFTKNEKNLARWSLAHGAIALLVGGVLAGGLVAWQTHQDNLRIQEIKQNATAAATQAISVPPNTGKVGGAFTLTSQDGKTVTDKDFSGKYLLVYFGYTSCPDMCPTGLQSISRALDQLGDDVNQVQPLFITVDPARDTAARLKEYDAAFHPKIVGLTGSDAQIAAVAKEYRVYYKKGEGDDDYEVEHSSEIYLMNPAGELVTTFDEEIDPKLIVAALRKAWGVSVPPVNPLPVNPAGKSLTSSPLAP